MHYWPCIIYVLTHACMRRRRRLCTSAIHVRQCHLGPIEHREGEARRDVGLKGDAEGADEVVDEAEKGHQQRNEPNQQG